MRGVWAIFKKEIRLYFVSPVAYAVFTIFIFICGWMFSAVFFFFTQFSMQAAMNPMMARDLNVTEGVFRPLFQNVSVIMLFMMPLITMRIFSEEKKSGTIELLLTYPVRDGEVLLGKYAAALALFLVMLGLTLLYPGIVTYFARTEPGPLLASYLGLFLLGAAFLALGILTSSFTENQIVAAAVGFGAAIIFWLLTWFSDFAGPVLSRILAHLSLLDHFENFAKGVIDTRDVIYYVNFSLLCLFLTLRSLESKRWRG